MSGRSPSTGVASLRARFEQNGEKTSPPSRGRSPAGSVTSDSSRPLSKVRTSFVAVEPSGRMASELGLKETEKGNEALAGDGLGNKRPATNGEATDKPVVNESESSPNGTVPATNPLVNVREDNASAGPTTNSKLDRAMDDAPNANLDKPASTAEEHTNGMLPSDPKDAGAVSGGAALADQTPGLGSILKGSAFEEKDAKEAKHATAPKSTNPTPKSPTTTAATQNPKPEAKVPSGATANGKPKEAKANKPAPQSMLAATVNGRPREEGKAKPLVDSKPQAAAPAPVETQTVASAAPANAADTSTAETKNDNPPAPRTPTSATASAKQISPRKPSPMKAASPKVASGKDGSKKDVAKEIKKSASRPSGVSKGPAALASKSHASSASKPANAPSTSVAKPPTKRSGPSSPSASAFTKPKPKSPTRPVKLPASATAPTAASAAKLDGTAPSMGDRRPMNMASVAKDKGPSTQPHLKAKSGRASMPGGSKPATEKPKAKARTSMAGTKAPEGGFLERMMRPTQSSAQKTHEKVESKSPPRKTAHPLKPRVTSGGDHVLQSHGDKGLEKVRDSPARNGHSGLGEGEGPQSSGQNIHAKLESKNHSQESGELPKKIDDNDHGNRGNGDVNLEKPKETNAQTS
ncbi:hypothetical protein P7C71_g5042, partial [Lecanoromycetidae sp. Uapishka_2]